VPRRSGRGALQRGPHPRIRRQLEQIDLFLHHVERIVADHLVGSKLGKRISLSQDRPPLKRSQAPIVLNRGSALGR
jgi:hypothetical protein